jgi:hypothetical protein
MRSDAAMTILSDEIGRLERELTATASGRSLCAISKSAGSVPGAKYLEGRLVAARELARQLDAGEVCDSGRGLLAHWQQALDDVTVSRFGADWLAYRAGGVDELTVVLELCGCPPTDLPVPSEGQD